MFDFEYRITLPVSKKILKAQDSEDKGEYKLTDLHLEYEIIESEDLVRGVMDQSGFTFGIRAVPQKMLHRQICLRRGLPHCRR